MLKVILDKQIVVIALGVFTAIGIFSKLAVNAVLTRLVRASSNMSKSDHALMRLVRAKFEHACMVSDGVENVGVFVDKYLYNYKVSGIRLHSLRRVEKAASLGCIVVGLVGALIIYSEYGMNDLVLRTGTIGVGLGVLVYVFHLTTDENYRIQMTRNYMVDYLENVCLHRYEKTSQKNEPIPERPRPEIVPPEEPEPSEEPDVDTTIRAMEVTDADSTIRAADAIEMTEEELLENIEKETIPEKEAEKAEEKFSEKEIRIRQILEEFMA